MSKQNFSRGTTAPKGKPTARRASRAPRSMAMTSRVQWTLVAIAIIAIVVATIIFTNPDPVTF